MSNFRNLLGKHVAFECFQILMKAQSHAQCLQDSQFPCQVVMFHESQRLLGQSFFATEFTMLFCRYSSAWFTMPSWPSPSRENVKDCVAIYICIVCSQRWHSHATFCPVVIQHGRWRAGRQPHCSFAYPAVQFGKIWYANGIAYVNNLAAGRITVLTKSSF